MKGIAQKVQACDLVLPLIDCPRTSCRLLTPSGRRTAPAEDVFSSFPSGVLLTEPCDCGYDLPEIIAQNIPRKICYRFLFSDLFSWPTAPGRDKLYVYGWAGTRQNIDGVIGYRAGDLLNVGVGKAK